MEGAQRADALGGLIIGETGTRNVTLSAGVLWFKLNRFPTTAIDTSGTDIFHAHYRDGLGGFTLIDDETQWDKINYDDNSGTLAALTTNRYGNIWWYLEPGGHLTCLYGRGNHVSIG